MKFLDRGSKTMKITSNIVLRDQSVVSLKCRVLQTLSHYRTAELLKLHGKIDHGILVDEILALGDAGQKHLAEKIKNAGIGGRASGLRQCDRAPDITHICIGNTGGTHI